MRVEGKPEILCLRSLGAFFEIDAFMHMGHGIQ